MPTDDELIAARAAELAGRSDGGFEISRFLTPHGQAVFFRAVAAVSTDKLNKLFFYGGCRGAERRAAVFFPDWAVVDDMPPCFPDTPLFSPEREAFFHEEILSYGGEEVHGITSVTVRGSGYRTLGHRDYLGSLLALGIDRSSVGDIVTDGEYSARIFLFSKIASLAVSELDRVGSDRVTVVRETPPFGFVSARRTEEVVVVAASMRLDALLGAVFPMSRSDAKELVERGLSEVNYLTEDRPERTLAAGDVVSARGYGKFEVKGTDGATRSGRVRAVVRKYV